jgi:hypothetical protein
MTLQEKELLSRFLQQLVAAQAGQKDAEADALIREAVSRQPDAAYLLVQRAMQLEQLLEGAEARAQKLQAELDQARSGSGAPSGGFLSDPAWGSRPGAAGAQRAPAQSAVTSPTGAPIPAAAPTATPPGAAARPSPWGGGSGMLGTVAGTAAGVVAGSFLFQGIQGLMHHGDSNAASAHHDADKHQLTDDSHGLTASTPHDDLSNIADISDDGDDILADSGDAGDDYA